LCCATWLRPDDRRQRMAARFAPQRGSPRIEWRVIGRLIINWVAVGASAPACWRNRQSRREGS
jgi:hypothetical protein